MSATDHAGAISFDKQDQVDKIQEGLLAGESLIAVYDGKGGGTGFIGQTNRRGSCKTTASSARRSP